MPVPTHRQEQPALQASLAAASLSILQCPPFDISAFILPPSIDQPFSVRFSHSARLQASVLLSFNSESSDSHYSLTVSLPFFPLAAPWISFPTRMASCPLQPHHTHTPVTPLLYTTLDGEIAKTNKNRNEATRRHHIPRKVLFVPYTPSLTHLILVSRSYLFECRT